jgi:prephenate dehydratase
LVRSVAVLFLLVSLLAGCSQKAPEHPSVKAVEEYCSIIQAVYLRQDLSLLEKIATEKEVKRVFPVIQALKAADNVMKTEIEEFTVRKAVTASTGDTATVETSERWKFWWEDRKTGSVTKEKKVEQYRLLYTIINDKGAWKVDQVRNQ